MPQPHGHELGASMVDRQGVALTAYSLCTSVLLPHFCFSCACDVQDFTVGSLYAPLPRDATTFLKLPLWCRRARTVRQARCAAALYPTTCRRLPICAADSQNAAVAERRRKMRYCRQGIDADCEGSELLLLSSPPVPSLSHLFSSCPSAVRLPSSYHRSACADSQEGHDAYMT